jgi:hypothetical protein
VVREEEAEEVGSRGAMLELPRRGRSRIDSFVDATLLEFMGEQW